MNFLLKPYLILVFLTGIPAGCANAQTVVNQEPPKIESPKQESPKIESPTTIDLSSDQAVIAELQKMVDAKAALLMKSDEKPEAPKVAASRIESSDVCIKRLKESAKIVVVGSFRTDVGCHFDGAFLNSRYFKKDDVSLSKDALEALGWEQATPTERGKSAKLWVEKGLLAFSMVIYTKDKDLNDRDFQPPQAVSAENGEIKVTLWIQRPPGMMDRARDFQRLEFRFDAGGNLMPGNSAF